MLSKNEFKKITSLFIIWRGFLFLVSYLANFFISYRPSFPYAAQLAEYNLPQWLYSWANFDGVHYLTIINKGYFGTGLIQAFFPLYPLSIKYLNFINNPLITGLLISTILSYLLFLSFYLFSKTFFKNNHWQNLLIFILFPTSFFFGAFYTESLFFILVLQTFIQAHRKNWLWAGILASLASATKVIGIILVPALLIEYFLENQTLTQFINNLIKNKSRKKLISSLRNKINLKSIRPIFLITIGSIGLFSYMSYLWYRFDDPLYFFHVQSEFGGGRQESLVLYPQVIFRYIKIILTARPFDLKYFSYIQEFISGTLGLLMILIASKKIKISHLIFVLGAFFVPTLTGTFSSMGRYILVCWPLFFVIGNFLKNKKIYYLYLVLSTLLLVFNTILFIQGYWVA
jgi:hypothetical protein